MRTDRRISRRVVGSEQPDRRRPHRGGQMHDAGIVAHRKLAPPDRFGRVRHRPEPGRIHRPARKQLEELRHQRLLAWAPGQEERHGVTAARQSLRKPHEPRHRPAARDRSRSASDVQRHDGIAAIQSMRRPPPIDVRDDICVAAERHGGHWSQQRIHDACQCLIRIPHQIVARQGHRVRLESPARIR